MKEEASANKPGVRPYRENHHNRLPLLPLRGLMYRREGPDGFVKDIHLREPWKGSQMVKKRLAEISVTEPSLRL